MPAISDTDRHDSSWTLSSHRASMTFSWFPRRKSVADKAIMRPPSTQTSEPDANVAVPPKSSKRPFCHKRATLGVDLTQAEWHLEEAAKGGLKLNLGKVTGSSSPPATLNGPSELEVQHRDYDSETTVAPVVTDTCQRQHSTSSSSTFLCYCPHGPKISNPMAPPPLQIPSREYPTTRFYSSISSIDTDARTPISPSSVFECQETPLTPPLSSSSYFAPLLPERNPRRLSSCKPQDYHASSLSETNDQVDYPRLPSQSRDQEQRPRLSSRSSSLSPSTSSTDPLAHMTPSTPPIFPCSPLQTSSTTTKSSSSNPASSKTATSTNPSAVLSSKGLIPNPNLNSWSAIWDAAFETRQQTNQANQSCLSPTVPLPSCSSSPSPSSSSSSPSNSLFQLDQAGLQAHARQQRTSLDYQVSHKCGGCNVGTSGFGMSPLKAGLVEHGFDTKKNEMEEEEEEKKNKREKNKRDGAGDLSGESTSASASASACFACLLGSASSPDGSDDDDDDDGDDDDRTFGLGLEGVDAGKLVQQQQQQQQQQQKEKKQKQKHRQKHHCRQRTRLQKKMKSERK